MHKRIIARAGQQRDQDNARKYPTGAPFSWARARMIPANLAMPLNGYVPNSIRLTVWAYLRDFTIRCPNWV